jgi:hypothetical protein
MLLQRGCNKEDTSNPLVLQITSRTAAFYYFASYIYADGHSSISQLATAATVIIELNNFSYM